MTGSAALPQAGGRRLIRTPTAGNGPGLKEAWYIQAPRSRLGF